MENAAMIASQVDMARIIAGQKDTHTIGLRSRDWFRGWSYELRAPWDAERLAGMFVTLADEEIWASAVVGDYLPSQEGARIAAAVDDVVEGKVPLVDVWNRFGLDTGSELFAAILVYVAGHRALLELAAA